MVDYRTFEANESDLRDCSPPNLEEYGNLLKKKDAPFEVRKVFGVYLANKFWTLLKSEDVIFWDKMIMDGVIDWREDGQVFNLEQAISNLKDESGLIGNEIGQFICERTKLLGILRNIIKKQGENSKNFVELIKILSEVQEIILKFAFYGKFCLRNRVLFLLNEGVMNGLFNVMSIEIKKEIEDVDRLKEFLKLFSKRVINVQFSQYNARFLPKGFVDMKEFEMSYDFFVNSYNEGIFEGVKSDFEKILKFEEISEKEMEKDLKFINDWKDYLDQKILVECLGENFGFEVSYDFRTGKQLFIKFYNMKFNFGRKVLDKYAQLRIELDGDGQGKLYFSNIFCSKEKFSSEDLARYLLAIFLRSFRLRMEKMLGVEMSDGEKETVELVEEKISKGVSAVVLSGEVQKEELRRSLSFREKQYLMVKILLQKSGREVLEIMEGVGLEVIRSRGSHFILRNEKGLNMPLPVHSDGVSKGVLFRFVKKMELVEKLFEKLGKG